MSLERKDVRGKLDSDYHEAFVAICDADGVTQGEFIEALLVPIIRDRVHAAKVLAGKLPRLPLAGSDRESPGTGGHFRERPGVGGKAGRR